MKQGLVWSLAAGFLCALQGAKVRSGSLRSSTATPETASSSQDETSTNSSEVEDSAERVQADDDFCPGNRFPLDPREIYVLPFLEDGTDIFLEGQLGALQAALEDAKDWSPKVTWQLSLKASSSAQTSAQLGFSGGGKGGFLGFTVPAHVEREELYTYDDVRVDGKQVHLVYSGEGQIPAGAITITDICLTPRFCNEADYCSESPGWKNKSSQTPLVGNTRDECCVQDQCSSVTVNCTPATKWTTPQDFDTRFGNTKEQCCMPIWCDFATVCSETAVEAKLKGATIQGSTEAECCRSTFCKDYKCSEPTELEVQPYLADGSLRVGSSDDECCAELLCEDFNCAKDPLGTWKNKSDPSGRGSTFAECCDKQYCGDFSCEPPSKWTNRSHKASLPGNSLDACCHAEMCEVYNCSEGWVKANGTGLRVGSSDTECCERKLCSTYTCSNETMWEIKPNSSTLRGFNDTECCDAKMCSDFECSDSKIGTKWTSKDTSELAGLQGSTPEQCCNPRYCRDYSCTSDSDGEGNGTKWHRKVDTNTHEWMGTTDEECCVPQYCSYYETDLPLTQWRKRTTPGLLGSTEEECYDPILCDGFNCTAYGMEAYPKPADYQGKTSEECCFKLL